MFYINLWVEELLGFGSEKMKDLEFFFFCIYLDDYDSIMSVIFEVNCDNVNWF